LVDELEGVPAVALDEVACVLRQPLLARCANVPSAHLAVKVPGAGVAPPARRSTADQDADLVNLLGSLPELNYPMFPSSRIKDIRKTSESGTHSLSSASRET